MSKTIAELRGLKDIPVIFITAKVQGNEIKHYIDSGAIGAIRKPFNPSKLASEINEIWSKQS